jgi:curved DNA-binding protein CbpA
MAKRFESTGLPSAALTALPLAPVEGFVLSRVEGVCTEEELALATGLDAGAVSAALERLVRFGAVRVAGGEPAAEPSPRGLTHAERDLFDRLEARCGDHYALLGVEADAERRAVKEAYYDLVALVHPDAFAGRDLGKDGARVAAIFSAVEAAHEVLTHRERRARYDAELAARATTTAISSGRVPAAMPSRAPAGPPSSEREPVSPAPVSGHILARKLGRSVPPPPLSSGRIAAASSGPISSGPISSGPISSGPISSGPISSGRLPTAPPPSGPGALGEDAIPTQPRVDAAAMAMAELRRRYEQLAPLARAEKLASLLAQGQAALAAGNGREALQAFRLAQSLAPEEPAVIRGLTQSESLAAPEVAKGYAFFAKRAEYADQATDARAFWEEAAQRAPDDAETQGRAAEALLRLEGDAASALRFAGRAVLLEPKRADFHALLGRAYVRQGMLRNAEREAQTAEALDASCSELTDLRRELASRTPVG